MMRAKHAGVYAWRTATIAVVALSALSAASALNLVQDPSFETTQSNNTYGFPQPLGLLVSHLAAPRAGIRAGPRRSGSLPAEASTL